MPADQVETTEAAYHQRIHDSQPEILEDPPAYIKRTREGTPVCADPVGENRQTHRLLWNSTGYALPDGFDDERISA